MMTGILYSYVRFLSTFRRHPLSNANHQSERVHSRFVVGIFLRSFIIITFVCPGAEFTRSFDCSTAKPYRMTSCMHHADLIVARLLATLQPPLDEYCRDWRCHSDVMMLRSDLIMRAFFAKSHQLHLIVVTSTVTSKRWVRSLGNTGDQHGNLPTDNVGFNWFVSASRSVLKPGNLSRFLSSNWWGRAIFYSGHKRHRSYNCVCNTDFKNKIIASMAVNYQRKTYAVRSGFEQYEHNVSKYNRASTAGPLVKRFNSPSVWQKPVSVNASTQVVCVIIDHLRRSYTVISI